VFSIILSLLGVGSVQRWEHATLDVHRECRGVLRSRRVVLLAAERAQAGLLVTPLLHLRSCSVRAERAARGLVAAGRTVQQYSYSARILLNIIWILKLYILVFSINV